MKAKTVYDKVHFYLHNLTKPYISDRVDNVINNILDQTIMDIADDAIYITISEIEFFETCPDYITAEVNRIVSRLENKIWINLKQ